MTERPGGSPPTPAFAHASEAELARILDFYEVRWEYEPDTFPILWNLDGDVVESFAPDFWLPDLGLYLELTTLKQRLVRRKNRKLRRLRELYPDVRIKLFYARDFRALLLKYGKLALAAELSGALGQVPPVRPPVSPALPPAGPDTPAERARLEVAPGALPEAGGDAVTAGGTDLDAARATPDAGGTPPAPAAPLLRIASARGAARRRRVRRRAAAARATERDAIHRGAHR